MTSPATPVRGLSDVLATLERAAPDVDHMNRVPEENFAVLADVGLYGASAPSSVGGLGLDLEGFSDVVERLASACLATTFVWIQHFRLLRACVDETSPAWLRARAPDVVSGALKGGVVLGSLLPGPTRLRATETVEGWRLDGEAPWVSGWGIVDALLVAARGPADDVLSFYVPARDYVGLHVVPQRLAAINATSTVRLEFRSMSLGPESLVDRSDYAPANEPLGGLRSNGSLALGIARRCATLLGPTSLDDDLFACRQRLERADAHDMAHARAAACELAVRAAHALSVARGSTAVLAGDVAERTAREASLLLSFASRPAIRAALLEQFRATPR